MRSEKANFKGPKNLSEITFIYTWRHLSYLLENWKSPIQCFFYIKKSGHIRIHCECGYIVCGFFFNVLNITLLKCVYEMLNYFKNILAN